MGHIWDPLTEEITEENNMSGNLGRRKHLMGLYLHKEMGARKMIFIAFHTTQWVPLNNILFKRKTIGYALCLMCDKSPEDNTNLICRKSYPHNRFPPTWKEIAFTLEKRNVDPCLRIILLQVLRETPRG